MSNTKIAISILAGAMLALAGCSDVVTRPPGGDGGNGGDGGSGGAGGAGGTGDTGGAGGLGGTSSVVCFRDADSDGYPAESEPMLFEGGCGAGYIVERLDSEWDCVDESDEIRPNQEMFFDSPHFPFGWDVNCDDVDERQYEEVAPGSCTPAPECSGSAWIMAVPDCGDTGDLVVCYNAGGGCASMFPDPAKQACR